MAHLKAIIRTRSLSPFCLSSPPTRQLRLHLPLISAAHSVLFTSVVAELPAVPLRVQAGDVTRGAAPPPRPAAVPAAGLARLPRPRRRRRHRPEGRRVQSE